MKRQLREVAKGVRSGSAIVGVLVVMVFMAIVAAAMVKSTGSQSMASRSYGSHLVAASTVNSAVIATGTHLSNRDNAIGTAAMICSLLNNPNYGKNRYLFGQHGKIPIAVSAPGQRFSSRLSDVLLNGSGVFAAVDVRSGAEAFGRDQRRATVFAELGGVTAGKVGGIGGPWASNAFFIGGGQLIGDSPLTIEGHATFANDSNPSSLLNPGDDGRYASMNMGANLLRFTKDSEGRGDVYFNGPADLRASNINFETNVYFNSQANLRGKTAFGAQAGFNKNFWSVGNEVLASKDVWMNGSFKSPEGYPDQTRFGQSPGSGATFHYNQEVFNDLDRLDFPSENQNAEKPAEMTTEAVLKKLDNMKPIEQRMEDELTLEVGNKAFCRLSDIISHPTLNWSVSGEKLSEFIKQARADPKYKNNFHPDPENGHFLLEENQGWGWAGGTFDGKVIIDVKGQLNANGLFFNTTQSASTMVYVNRYGKLNNWGPAKGGTFHGLVYVHPQNREEQVFAGGRIEGAVLLKGGKKMYTPTGGSMTIAKNDKVLEAFGSMLKKPNGQLANEGVPSGGGEIYETQLTEPAGGIDFQVFGYYFY
ncbi:MAG: hypothetical protein FWB85_01405 [Chitinispirillia bacterium]|nr:hypothetical protein [Chitinispirillia bacterium]MCL2241354.1 hypothetical protein [Chitinispirillia bacterium]